MTEEMLRPEDRAVAVSIERHSFGVTRKIDKNSLDLATTGGEKVSQDLVSITKKLFSSEEYDAIMTLDHRFDSNMRIIASSTQFLRNGTYLVATTLFGRTKKIFDEYAEERETKVNAFIDKYDDLVREAEKLLGPMFNEKQYPDREAVRGKFSVKLRVSGFDIPKRLQEIDADFYEKSTAALKEEIDAAHQEAMLAMRAGICELVENLKDKLTPTDDGKKKVLRDSAVTKLSGWLDLFEDRNIFKDKELKNVVDQLRALTQGMEPDKIRKDGEYKEYIREVLADVSTELSGLVSVQNEKRKMSLSMLEE